MKNSVKIILAATALCVAVYIGVFVGRNWSGISLHVTSLGKNQITLSQLSDAQAALVNINRATADELMELPGIGKATAQAIIEYRETYGKFISLKELLEVRGINMDLLNKIWPYITVGD